MANIDKKLSGSIGFDDPLVRKNEVNARVQQDFDQAMQKALQDPEQFANDMNMVAAADVHLPPHPQVLQEQSPQGQARQQLSELYQEFCDALLEATNNLAAKAQAELILTRAKTLAQEHGIDWQTLPKGWSLKETELRNL